MLPRLDDFLLNLKANNYSAKTVYSYGHDLKIFDKFLTENGIDFNKLDKKTIAYYKACLVSSDQKAAIFNEQSERELDSHTVNRMLSALRSYLRYLLDIDYSCPVAPESVKLEKGIRKHFQLAELNDLVRLIEAPSYFEADKKVAFRNRAMLEVLFATGMRISELVRLNREQINLKRKEFRVMGKGSKVRVVFLSDIAANWIERYLKVRKDNFKPLFIRYSGTLDTTKDGERMRLSARSIQLMVDKYAKKCGLPVKATPHSLRQGFATYLAERDAKPVTIHILLGHESLNTTTRYVHTSDKYAEETHKKFHHLAQTGENKT